MLVKLGELPPPGGRASTVRVIDASRQPETYEYLKRLKEQWESSSPNTLIIRMRKSSKNLINRNPSQRLKPPAEKPAAPKTEVTRAANANDPHYVSLADDDAKANENSTANNSSRTDNSSPTQPDPVRQILFGQMMNSSAERLPR